MFFLIIFLAAFRFTHADSKSLMAKLEEKFESKLSDYTLAVTKYLGDFNDRNLVGTEIGRIIHYADIKPKLEGTGETSRKERSVKKMSMAMMPLIFHVGATSTWMILTALMAAKSVAIGLLLLVFKIAVSSAKVASFFTTLKNKHSGHHHHDYSWTPHFEHGHERSLSPFAIPEIHHDPNHEQDWHSYSKTPEWTPNDSGYKTIDPSYKSSDFSKDKVKSSYFVDSSSPERRR